MDHDVVINPFGGKAFVLNTKVINELLIPLVNAQTEPHEEAKQNSEAILVGRTVDERYVLKRVIGRGGITNVYLGEDAFGTKYAIKVLDKKRVSNKSVIDTLIGEVQLLKKIDHPSIRKVIDICDEEAYLFIIFEYVDGINFEEVLRHNNGKALSTQIVIEYIKQVVLALQHIHSMNPPIVNRDIKPRNIVVDNNGEIKLVDFDIAIENKPGKRDDAILGTKGYAPPEQYNGMSEPRSDIYALGMTMRCLVTGIEPNKPSYEEKPICETNSELPKSFGYIIDKCTKANIDERYRSCNELLSDLANYQNLPHLKGVFKKIFGGK